MKSTHIAKTLSLIALTSLALAAGSSQAQGWGGNNPYLPIEVEVAPVPHDGLHDFERGHVRGFDGSASIDARQHEQLERIQRGVEHGRISRREARDLLGEQRAIELAQRSYLADGRLSRDEYASLDRMLDQSGAHIDAERHDRDGYGRNWR